MACQAASAVSLIHPSNLEAQQGLQLPHDSPLRSLSKLAGADLILVRKEPRRPSSLISDDSDDSEASQPTKQPSTLHLTAILPQISVKSGAFSGLLKDVQGALQG